MMSNVAVLDALNTIPLINNPYIVIPLFLLVIATLLYVLYFIAQQKSVVVRDGEKKGDKKV